MSMPPPLVMLASAGTGKTHQLTSRCIGLLVDEVAPESLLATTFTRKAAGEILARVLERLAAGARGAEAAAALARSVGAAGLDAAACGRHLGTLLRHIDRLQVQTLDAFFVRLASLAGFELGLPPGWRILDEADVAGLHQAAFQRMLERAEPRELAALLSALQREEPGRSTYLALQRIVGQAYAVYLQGTREAWDALEVPDGLAPEELAARLVALRAASLPATAKGAPDSRWLQARESAVRQCDEAAWDEFLAGGLVKPVAASLRTGGGEAPSYCRKPIEGPLLASLEALVRHAWLQQLQVVRQRGLAMRELLDRFHAALLQCKRERRLYEFDDLPRLLTEGAPLGLGLEELGFRRDAGIEHLLLDEFQDTSVQQARVLAPLIARVLEPGQPRSFFCVGDVKQSIYGWRQGESRLLESLPERHGLQPQTLEDNRRSSRVVLEAVSLVFGGLGQSAVFADDPPLTASARRWQAGFRPPGVVRRELPGHAALLEVPTEGKDVATRRRAVLTATVHHVARLAEEAPRARIGVLVRRRAAMPLLIHGLMQRGVAASGEGGNPLVDSEAVRVALSLLTLADHPGDSAAAFHVATSPLAGALGLEPPLEAAPRQALAADVRERLVRDGYGATFAWLAGLVSAADGFERWDRVRFPQLVDLATAYDERASLRPQDFVARIWEQRVEAPTRAPVSVMTVHGAKGLEFDAVVLPDLEGDLRRFNPQLVKHQPSPWERFDLIVPWSRREAPSAPLQELVDEARGRALEEQLCVLYVGMTRAVRRLDLLVAQPAKGDHSGSLPALLRGALVEGAGHDVLAGQPAPAAEGLRVLWQHPENAADWTAASAEAPSLAPEPALAPEAQHGRQPAAAAARPGAAAADDSAAAAAPLRLAARPQRACRRHASPSARVVERELGVVDLLGLRDPRARLHGLLVHAWLAELEWYEPSAWDEPRLRALGLAVARHERLELSPELLTAELARCRALLERPVTRQLLSRPQDGLAREVWRERRFAVLLPADQGGTVARPAGHGTAAGGAGAARDELLMRGAFDRVVLVRDGERCVSAEIIDYKTDALAPDAPGASGEPAALDALEARAKHHRPQMEAYRDVLVALTGLPRAQVRCRLLFLSIDRVVDC